jgi:hypothetical protein
MKANKICLARSYKLQSTGLLFDTRQRRYIFPTEEINLCFVVAYPMKEAAGSIPDEVIVKFT